MSANRRKAVLPGILIAALVATVGWAHGKLSDARRSAQAAGERLAACRLLAAQIGELRDKPNIAKAETLQMAALARKVERAAKVGQLPPDAVTRIWPDTPRRIGETVYMEKPTQIVLKNVGMRQLVTFLHSLTTETPGVWVKSLRLMAPRGKESGQTWSVQAVVSYLIFEPPKAPRKRGG